MGNQYTAKNPKLHRLPSIAVTAEERELLHAIHVKYRVGFAQMLRMGMVAGGFFPSESLDDDLPAELVQAALKGEARATLRPPKG